MGNELSTRKTRFSSERLREKLSTSTAVNKTEEFVQAIKKPEPSISDEQRMKDQEAQKKALQREYVKHIVSELDLVKITLSQDPTFLLTAHYEKACRGVEQWLRSRHKTLDNTKGLIIWGWPGTGKTSICEAITQQKARVMKMVEMQELHNDYLQKDGPSAKYYKTTEYNHKWNDRSVLRDCGLIINDVGAENIIGDINNYGSKQIPAFSYWVNAMEPFFKKNPHLRNHFIITTNLSEEKILEIYHDRVMSRLRMYFNFVPFGFDGKSPIDGDMRNPANRKRYENK